MVTLMLQLFWVFFQIGLFGFGGGYAMLSMIQAEVVTRHHWLTTSQFTDIVAISQMTPGPIGINAATYVGYTSLTNAGNEWYWGIIGSAIATMAVVLPSFILMLVISRFLISYWKHPAVGHIFRWLRPAVVGLLAAAALCLMTTENFSTPSVNLWRFCVSLLLFAFAFLSVSVYRISPIRIIIVCAIAGLVLM